MHRFPNLPVTAGGTLYWDILRLLADVQHGLELAGAPVPLAERGPSTPGASDYGLLDETGALLANPVHYRDRAHRRSSPRSPGRRRPLPAAELYAVTGIQQLAFNTVYQLAATPMLRHARTMLLIPDLLAYWLTGELGHRDHQCLHHVAVRRPRPGLGHRLIRKLGVPPGIFPPLRRPGDVIGPLIGPNGPVASLPLIAVGSHDTASAVAGMPAEGPDFAYISSGTWSLAGVELDAPVLTAGEPSRQLHQRDRYRRHDPLPAQRDGLVVAAGELRGWAGGLARSRCSGRRRGCRRLSS